MGELEWGWAGVSAEILQPIRKRKAKKKEKKRFSSQSGKEKERKKKKIFSSHRKRKGKKKEKRGGIQVRNLASALLWLSHVFAPFGNLRTR